MKVIINKTGSLEDLTDRDAKRRIQRGQAHPAPIVKVKRKKKAVQLESDTKQNKELQGSEVLPKSGSGYSRQHSTEMDK